VVAGFSYPLGEFASADPKDKNAGLAQNGVFYQLNFSRFLSSHVGMAISIFEQENPVNGDRIVIDLRRIYSPSVTVRFGNWINAGLMAGIHYKIHAGKNSPFCFHARLQLGFVNCSTPEYHVRGNVNGAALHLDQDSFSAIAPVYSASGGVSVSPNKYFSIVFWGNFMDSYPDFPNATTTINSGISVVNSFEQNMVTWNAGAGIVFIFP
jgi:hypothetical protein